MWKRFWRWVRVSPNRCMDCGARLRVGEVFCSVEHETSYRENLPWR